MNCDADDSSTIVRHRYAPYSSAISRAASASTASLWSDVSDDTPTSASASDSDSCENVHRRAAPAARNQPNHRQSLHQQGESAEALPAELRQNPRRSGPSSHTNREGCPPALVRQSDRKVNFVDNLVDSSTQIVEAIWPLSSAVCRSEIGNKAVLPLRTFIQETLRRSRTSYSTLQVALYYLILIKPHVPKANCATDRYDDSFADQALQCGRRMFLAALILASKYLQDRNYSARAWSKISGLNTQEINQNEIAFLLAVNWKLHITDDIFRRWTDIVLKFTPSPLPPSPGAVSPTYVQQMANWKQLILSLEPQLTNVHGLVSAVQVSASANDLRVHTPRSILNHPQDHRGANTPEYATISPKACTASAGAEAASHYACNAGRPAPVLGPLPTPRLTPRICGFNTPAASAPSQILGRPNSMGFAMAQVGSVNSTQTTFDRVVGWASSSPHAYCPIRRSSLANSVSTASSPESMVSDSSRSSSVSSVSSLASATIGSGNSRCGLPSRSRVAKLWNDRVSLKPSVPPVPEDIQEFSMAASPEAYVGPEMRLGELALQTPLGRHESDLDAMARDPASDAARALQDLHNYNTSMYARSSGRKRSRGLSTSGSLHGKMPEILNLGPASAELSPSPLSQSHSSAIERHLAAPIIPAFGRSAKRVCCSAEAASDYQTATMHPAIGLRGRGMWDGILN